MMGKDMGVASERNAGLEIRIQPADKTALVRGLFRKYAPEPKYGTKDDKRRFKGWSDIDSFDAVERCVSANKAVTKISEAIAKLTGEPEELEGTSVCSECRLTFFSATHLKYHQLFIANDKKPEDDKTIADVGSSDPSTGMLFCPWCPVLLQGPLVLIRHMKICREKKNHPSFLRSEVSEDFLCSDCQKLFDCEDDLWRHIYVAHGLPYKCNRCPEYFTSKKQFKTHIMTCSGEENPKCSDCHEMFPRPRELLRHVTLTPHCKLVEPYVCEKCHVSLTNRKLVLTHLWKHVRTSRTLTNDINLNPRNKTLQDIPETDRCKSAPVENEPFDPFKVPDFFKSRPVQKSPEKRRETDYDHLKSPESTKQSELDGTLNRHETPHLFERTDPSEAFQGFDDDRGPSLGDEGAVNRESDVQAKVPRSQIGSKKIIGFILDHPYSLPSTDEGKHGKKYKPKKSVSSKQPSKNSETNSSRKKKVENNKEEKSKMKRESTESKKKRVSTESKKKSVSTAGKLKSFPYVVEASTEKQPQQESPVKDEETSGKKRRIKSKPKKRTMGTSSAEIDAVQSAPPQAPSAWEDDVGVMPLIQSVTSINDWNALPDASEPLSPMKKRKKKKKIKKVAIDENVLNFLKETGEDPSSYEFVFFSDSDDRETDVDPVTVAEDEPIQIEDPTPVEKPNLDYEPLLIPLDEPVSFVGPVTVNESVSVDQLILIDESRSVEQPPLIENLRFVEEPILIEDPHPVVELTPVEEPVLIEDPHPVVELTPVEEPVLIEDPHPVIELTPAEEPIPIEESTLAEDAVLLPIPADSNLNANKISSTNKTKSQKDVISNYDSIPMFIPFGNHLTDVCLIDPWDANRLNNTVNVGKSRNSKKQSLMHVPNRPVIFDATIQPEPNVSVPELEQPNKVSSRPRGKVSTASPGYVLLDGDSSINEWIPLSTCLPREVLPPLRPIVANTNDSVIVNNAPEVDLGLLSLALAAEAVSNQKRDKLVPPLGSPVGMEKCDIVRAVDDVVKQHQMSTQLVPSRRPNTTKATVRRFMFPMCKEKFNLLFNGDINSPEVSFSPMLLQLPARILPPTSASIVKLSANCKDSAGPRTGKEGLEAVHLPSWNFGSVSSALQKKTAVVESSEKSFPVASTNRRAELKSSEEYQVLSRSNCCKASRKDKALLPEREERAEAEESEVTLLGAGSPASSHSDDDFPDESNESDWDFDNPVSPSYSFVGDGEDYSPGNAPYDSSGNSSPERASSPEKVSLPDVKVVLTRLERSEESNNKNSEEISRTERDHVCPYCDRSFKTESGYKIHIAKGSKDCTLMMSSNEAKHGRFQKPLSGSLGKNRSIEQRELIQAELSDLSSSLNDIFPEGSPEESYKPVGDDGKISRKSEFTCECCNRTFKCSAALNMHLTRRLLTKKTVNAERTLKEDKVVSETEVSSTVNLDMSEFQDDTQPQSSDTDLEDVGELNPILDEDLESSNKGPPQKKTDAEASEEGNNVKTAEEEVTTSENYPATVDKLKSAETPVSEPVMERDELPSCDDDIVINVCKVAEAAHASCKVTSDGEAKGAAEAGVPEPLTVKKKTSLIGAGGSETPVYVCSYCYRKFFTETSLKIHLAWEKKREKRKRVMQEFVPKVTLDGEIKLVDVRERAETSADQPQAAWPSRRSVSARKSSNEASIKILASSKSKREIRPYVTKNNGHSPTTPKTKLVSESAVEPKSVSEPALESKTYFDSAVEQKLSSEPTVESKLDSEPIAESKIISESADGLKTTCELKSDPESAVESRKPLCLDSDDKEVIDKGSSVNPESEEQFLEISDKILMVVESELKVRSPRKDSVESKEESKTAPMVNAAAPAVPTEDSSETQILANAVNEILSEEGLVLVPDAKAEPSSSKSATPHKAKSRKKLSSSKSPLKQKSEAFKISRSGRRIKKKKRLGVDDNFGVTPKALEISTLTHKKPLKQLEAVAINSQDLPAESKGAAPVPTEAATPVKPEGATPVTTEGATPVPKEGATPVPKEGATPVPTEGATSFTTEGATPVTTEAATPVKPEGATPVTTEGATPVPKEGATPVPTEGAMPDASEVATPIGKAYQCKTCLVWFSSKQKLGGHRRRYCKQSVLKKFNTSLSCRICKAVFKTLNQLITHRKLKKKCENHRLRNSAVALSTPSASSAVPSEGACDKVPVPKEERAKFSCKVCGRVFRSERSLMTHKWQRLKRGSSKTFCVPIRIKSVHSDGKNERRTTEPGVTPNPSKAQIRRRRRGLKFTLKKNRGNRQQSSTETGVENVFTDVPRSALANDQVPGLIYTCSGCAQVFKSHWALNAHSRSCRNPFCVRKTESDSTVDKTAPVEPAVTSDDASGQNLYPCTCFRVFSSLRALKLHRSHSYHPDSPSLSAAESKTSDEILPAEVTPSTERLACETCGRKFVSPRALSLHSKKSHMSRAASVGGKSCISKSRTCTEVCGETTEAERATEVPVDCASGKESVEASFESAKDVLSDASFTSAKGDEFGELPVESARGEVPVEAPVEVLLSNTTDTHNVQSPAEAVCQLCRRSFPSVQSLRMHLYHRKRRGFCGLDPSTTIVDDTATSFPENDDTNDSSVAPNLPLDETSLAFDPRTDEDSGQQSPSLKDPDGMKRADLSESSSLHTSEGDSKSENRRSRSSKGKKIMLLKSLYQCDLCSTNYSYLKSLFRHVETAHGNEDLKCDDCGMTFHSVQGLQIHVMTKETRLFKSAFEPVKPNELVDVQASSSKGAFEIPEDENRPGEVSLTEGVPVATTKAHRRRGRKKKFQGLNAREEGAGADHVVVKEAGRQDVPEEKSGLTAAVAAATTKPGKRRKREKKSDGKVGTEGNSAAPTSEVPAKSVKRRRKQAGPNAPEEESTLTENAPNESRKRKKKSGDLNITEEESTLHSTVEAQVTPRKRKKKSEDQKAPGEEISPSVETPKSSEDEKKNPDEANLTSPAKSDENLELKAEVQTDEKLKPKVESQSEGKLKSEAVPKEENASSSVGSLAKPEKHKTEKLESSGILSTPKLSSPVRKNRSTKTPEIESEVPPSPSTPSRTLRSNAKATPVSDPEDCSPTPTRTVTFILSFENKNVRFVSLKCYPQQPPNPIVHCSKCKECMMKEQIKDHDCESNHFICMCQKCRLDFPYDQYTLMGSNSKRRLTSTPSSPELDAKLKTVSSDTPDTYPTVKCPTTLLMESNKIKKCALCGEVMDSFSKLEKHLKMVHTKLLTCLKCGTCFSETKAWESHVQLDTCSSRSPLTADCGLDRPASDETCPTECAPKMEEERSQHPRDSCKTLFDSVEKLDGHSCPQGSASPRKLFRCSSCSHWFQNELMLRTHKKEDCCNK